MVVEMVNLIILKDCVSKAKVYCMLWTVIITEFRRSEKMCSYLTKGPNPGQFEVPCYIAVDSSDQVYVTD